MYNVHCTLYTVHCTVYSVHLEGLTVVCDHESGRGDGYLNKNTAADSIYCTFFTRVSTIFFENIHEYINHIASDSVDKEKDIKRKPFAPHD